MLDTETFTSTKSRLWDNASFDFGALADELCKVMTQSYIQGFIQSTHYVSLDTQSDIDKALRKLKLRKFKGLRRNFAKNAREYLRTYEEATSRRFRLTLRQEIAKGTPQAEIEKILRRKYNRSVKGIETLFRTHSSIAISAGKQLAESQDPRLWGYRYLTAEDERVRPAHDQYHRVTLPKDHSFWDQFYPPNGWRCRCKAKPLFRKSKIILPPENPLPIDSDFLFNPGELVFT